MSMKQSPAPTYTPPTVTPSSNHALESQDPLAPNGKTLLLCCFAEQTFSFAGPAVWNALPAELRSIKSKDTFRRRLKTHYFTLTF